MNPVSVLLLALVGILVAYIQSRIGVFEALPANWKQLITAFSTFVVPAVVSYLTPYWQPDFGDLPEFVSYIFFLLAPAIVWLAGQVGHQVDRAMQKVGNK